MIGLIIVLGILQCIYYYVFKPKLNTLGCGIFGQATNNPSKINSANLKILGMMNESRGKNSCGITIDGEIFHGLEKEKLFTDFAKGKTFKAKKYPLVFGHTRSASVGVVNHHNAHPFGFGDNDEGYQFIGVHNGTLENHEELAKKYGIDDFPKHLVNNVNHYRKKIDSEILLEIIQTKKNVKVLSEYNGKAALVWTNTEEPETIYLYSGKSVEDEGDAQNTAKEERPMNVWIESKNNFYFSSIPEALHVIGGDPDTVFQIKYNTVFKIKNGDFRNAEMINISRLKNYQDRALTKYSKNNNNVIPYVESSRNTAFKSSPLCTFDLNKIPKRFPNDRKSSEEMNIFNDNTLHNTNKYGNRIFTKQLRYFRNGHAINGIYLYIKNYGFYYVGNEVEDIHKKIKENIGKTFVYSTGMFKDGVYSTSEGHVPFISSSSKEAKPYYFIDGVMLRLMIDYNILRLQRRDNVNLLFSAEKLSHCSEYPVFNHRSKPRDDEQKIFYNGSLYTGVIEGIDFEKKYFIQDGNLINTKIITDEEPEDDSIRKNGPNLLVLNTVIHDLAKYEVEFIRKEKSEEAFLQVEDENIEITTNDDISEYLCDVALETFCNIDDEIDTLIENIDKYKNHAYYKVIKDTITDVQKSISEYIATKKIENE